MWVSPHEIATIFLFYNATTFVGNGWYGLLSVFFSNSFVSSNPSCPYVASPQANIIPSFVRAIEWESPQANWTINLFYKLSIFFGTGINGQESTSKGIAEIFPKPS